MELATKRLVISALLMLPVSIVRADGSSAASEGLSWTDFLGAPAWLIPEGAPTKAVLSAGGAKAAPAKKGGAKDLTDADYKKETELSTAPSMVMFCTPTDAYCREAEKAVDALAKEYAGRAKIMKVNVDLQPKLAKDNRVIEVPTYVFYKGGKDIMHVGGKFPVKTADIKPFLKLMIDDFLFGKKP